MSTKRLKKQFSFPAEDKDVYDYLENCSNASALVRKLVRQHMILEDLENQGYITNAGSVRLNIEQAEQRLDSRRNNLRTNATVVKDDKSELTEIELENQKKIKKLPF